MLKFFIGDWVGGMQVDYLNVSIIWCEYLKEKSESEAQIRIGSTGVENSEDIPMSELEEVMFKNLNKPIRDVIKDEGVADLLIVGPEELKQHVLTLDSSGSGIRHAEGFQPRNSKDISTQRKIIRWDSPSGSLPGSPPGSRPGSRLCEHRTQQEDIQDPFPGREVVRAQPPHISPHSVSWSGFHSRCDTCFQTFRNGPDRRTHAELQGHSVICNLCEPPMTFDQVEHLYCHYKDSGHTDIEQPESLIGQFNSSVMPSTFQVRGREPAGSPARMSESFHLDENDKSVQPSPAEHLSIRIKEEPRIGTITTAIQQRHYDSSIEFGGSAIHAYQTQHQRNELGGKGKQGKRKKIENARSQVERGNKEWGEKDEKNRKTMTKIESNKTGKGDFKRSNESIVNSEINVRSRSLSPEQYPQKAKMRKKKRKKITDASISDVDTNTLPLSSLSPPPLHKPRSHNDADVKDFSRHDSRPLPTSSLTSLFSLSPSLPSLPPQATSVDNTATFVIQNPDDQRRLREILDKQLALDIEEDELRLKRDKLKLHAEELKLEIRKRQLAETVTSCPSPIVVECGSKSGSSAAPPKKPVTCSACGESGHNRRNKCCRFNEKHNNTK